MRVLLLCDDHYHPGHVPAEGLAPLGAKGIDLTVQFDAAAFSPDMLPNYDVVIMSKCDNLSSASTDSWKTPAVQQAFVSYVENGGGLLVTHNGTVAGKNTGVLDALIGCRFASHPKDCPVTTAPVKPHPIAAGVSQFTVVDEHYHLHMLAPDADVFLASYAAAQGSPDQYQSAPYENAPESLQPAGYTRTQGQGRICVLTPGHTTDVWLLPDMQQLLENALRWVAQG